MLQAVNSDLFNPFVPNAHNSKCKNLLFSLQIKPVKISYSQFADFFFAPSALMD